MGVLTWLEPRAVRNRYYPRFRTHFRWGLVITCLITFCFVLLVVLIPPKDDVSWWAMPLFGFAVGTLMGFGLPEILRLTPTQIAMSEPAIERLDNPIAQVLWAFMFPPYTGCSYWKWEAISSIRLFRERLDTREYWIAQLRSANGMVLGYFGLGQKIDPKKVRQLAERKGCSIVEE
jgi:hypothetical protein